MSKIKVTVKDIKTANEIIQFWKDEDLNLEIKVNKNTTAANSDASFVPNNHELNQISSEIIGILLKHKLNHLSVTEVLKLTENIMSERSYHLTLKREY